MPGALDSTREFIGTVELPARTTMNLSLAIRGPSARSSLQLPTFFATLIAQQTATVTGTYTLGTLGARVGRVEGSFVGPSFLTAGQFDGTLTEVLNGCVAQRRYAGAISVAGIAWSAGGHIQQCPAGTFDGLEAIEIAAVDAIVIGDPDPVPAPAEPMDVFRLTVATAGDGTGNVMSDPAGIDCGRTCSWLFATDTIVTLTADPIQGSEFGGWTGDPDCGDGEVTMTSDVRCVARFDSLSTP